ncbi:hypothetical protein ACIA8K_29175 [Catenuloplanes sp. NPDC051500]|uniref:hypothetical protein n=1 Tax=Catenuloplanes sp. NPDC051500 TaxID=3363959 RepID=UPI0037B03FC5
MTTDTGRVVWAWWSKDAGSRADYAVLAGNATRDELPGVEADLERFRLASPPEHPSSPLRALPWVAIVQDHRGTPIPPGHHEVTVLWWDWAGHSDGVGRAAVAVLYLRLILPAPVPHLAVAEYARTAWQVLRADRTASLPALRLPGGPGTADDWLEDGWFDFLGATAALALRRPVRITAADGEPLDWFTRLRCLSAAATLLPAGLRPSIWMCTWLDAPDPDPFNLAFAAAAPAGTSAVPFGGQPDLEGNEAVRGYFDVLLQMRAHYGDAAVLRHLARGDAVVPAELGSGAARQATAYLGMLDRLHEVGTLLAQGEPVDPAEVRRLVDSASLADRLPPGPHLAYLRFLLHHGGVDDLPRVQRHWLPAALAELAAAAARPRPAAWQRAVVRLAQHLRLTDELFDLVLADSAAAIAALDLLRLAGAPGPGEAVRTRARLLDPAHAGTVRELLPDDTGGLLAWLSWLDGPGTPDWVKLLLAALNSGPVPDHCRAEPAWVERAGRIAEDRRALADLLPGLAPMLIAGLDTVDGRAVAADWLAGIETEYAYARGTIDFVLLCAGGISAPGLRKGSPFATDAGYARGIAVQAGAQPRWANTVLERLGDHISGHDGTADALRLLELLRQEQGFGLDDLADRGIHAVDARPELTDRLSEDPESPETKVWERMTAKAPRVEKRRVLRDLSRAADQGAEPGRFALPLDRARMLACASGEIATLLLRWRHWNRLWWELTEALAGRLPSATPETDRLTSTVAFLAQTLPDRERDRYLASVRGLSRTTLRQIDKEQAVLEKRRRLWTRVGAFAGEPGAVAEPGPQRRRFPQIRIGRWQGRGRGRQEMPEPRTEASPAPVRTDARPRPARFPPARAEERAARRRVRYRPQALDLLIVLLVIVAAVVVFLTWEALGPGPILVIVLALTLASVLIAARVLGEEER